MRDRHNRKVNQLTLGIDLFAWLVAFLAGLLIRYGSFLAVDWSLYTAVFLGFAFTYILIYYFRTHRHGHYPADQKTPLQNVSSGVQSFLTGFTGYLVVLIASQTASLVSRLALFYMGLILLPLLVGGRLLVAAVLTRIARRKGSPAARIPSSPTVVTPSAILNDEAVRARAFSLESVILDSAGDSAEDRGRAIALLHENGVDVWFPLNAPAQGDSAVPLPAALVTRYASMAAVTDAALLNRVTHNGVELTLAAATEVAFALQRRPDAGVGTTLCLIDRKLWRILSRDSKRREALSRADLVVNADIRTGEFLHRQGYERTEPLRPGDLVQAFASYEIYRHYLLTDGGIDFLSSSERALFAFLPLQNRYTRAEEDRLLARLREREQKKTPAILWVLLEDSEAWACAHAPVAGALVIACPLEGMPLLDRSL